jgi:hypothetical protein
MQLNWPTQEQPRTPPVYQQPQQPGQRGGYQRQAYNPRDRIYLTPITVENDPYGDTNMLFCDGEDKLSTSHVDKSVIDFVHDILGGYRAKDKYCAVACLDVERGKSVTFGFEIDYEDALALDCIVAAARDGKIVNAMVPETFRNHMRRIIRIAYSQLPRRLECGEFIEL